MNITVSKVKKIMMKDYGWGNMDYKDKQWFMDEVISDTLKIVNDVLKKHKGISIKN